MPTTKSRELFLLERFIPQLIEQVEYSLEQPDPPLPDVIIEAGGRKIGIELTELIINDSEKRKEVIQESVLKEAQKEFEERYALPLHVTVSFTDSLEDKGLKKKLVAEHLAEIIIHQISQIKDELKNQESFSINLNRLNNQYFHSISIFYLSKLTIPCWSPLNSFWVPELPHIYIQEVITQKSKKVKGYLSGCEEVWLLILENGSPSSYFDNYENVESIVFESAFSKTIIGRIPQEDLINLKVKPFSDFGREAPLLDY